MTTESEKELADEELKLIETRAKVEELNQNLKEVICGL